MYKNMKMKKKKKKNTAKCIEKANASVNTAFVIKVGHIE